MNTPNRVFDPSELKNPQYQKVQQRLEQTLQNFEGCYLHPSKRWEYPWALERADLFAGCRILDAGCGGSVFPLFLGSEGFRVIALDIEIPEVRPDTIPMDYVSGSIPAMPFYGESFDRVFCISVIEHMEIEQMVPALNEIKRVLKKGGALLLTTDYYSDADVELWYQGPGQRFRVDWNVFDRGRLNNLLSSIRGFRIDGELDLSADWGTLVPQMLEFHGYPYTSVGVKLVKT